MLNRIRKALGPVLDKIGFVFASSGLSPNFWTTMSLIFAAASSLTYMSATFFEGTGWYHYAFGGSIMLLISGFFDIVDGSVARAAKQRTKKGAFLDSMFDRISESIIFIGIAVGGLANPIVSQVAIILSLLVSYTRAKSEALGIELKGVGIGERAERLMLLGFLGLIPLEGALQLATIIVIIFAGITLCQRIILTNRKL